MVRGYEWELTLTKLFLSRVSAEMTECLATTSWGLE